MDIVARNVNFALILKFQRNFYCLWTETQTHTEGGIWILPVL